MSSTTLVYNGSLPYLLGFIKTSPFTTLRHIVRFIPSDRSNNLRPTFVQFSLPSWNSLEIPDLVPRQCRCIALIQLQGRDRVCIPWLLLRVAKSASRFQQICQRLVGNVCRRPINHHRHDLTCISCRSESCLLFRAPIFPG